MAAEIENDRQWNNDAQAAALVARCAMDTLIRVSDLERRDAAHPGVIADMIQHAAHCQRLSATLYAKLREYSAAE